MKYLCILDKSFRCTLKDWSVKISKAVIGLAITSPGADGKQKDESDDD